jgi:hypothetical protein
VAVKLTTWAVVAPNVAFEATVTVYACCETVPVTLTGKEAVIVDGLPAKSDVASS